MRFTTQTISDMWDFKVKDKPTAANTSSEMQKKDARNLINIE